MPRDLEKELFYTYPVINNNRSYRPHGQPDQILIDSSAGRPVG